MKTGKSACSETGASLKSTVSDNEYLSREASGNAACHSKTYALGDQSEYSIGH